MSLFAGVEGGATRSTLAIMDASGTIRARAEGPAIGISPEPPDVCVDLIVSLVHAGLDAIDAAPPVAAVCCGLTGAGRGPERRAVEARLIERGLAGVVKITTDVEVAFFDAFADGPGILLIAGTGSAAWGRAPDGRNARIGGWGPLAGDEGSGYAVGSAALRAVLAAFDGRTDPTALTAPVLEIAGVGAPPDLVRWADRAGKRGIAALAPAVIGAAARDDAAAVIVHRATADLARHVEAAARRLEPWPGTIDVALNGGLIAPDQPLHGTVAAAIRAACPAASILTRSLDGARGAALLALRAAGGSAPGASRS